MSTSDAVVNAVTCRFPGFVVFIGIGGTWGFGQLIFCLVIEF